MQRQTAVVRLVLVCMFSAILFACGSEEPVAPELPPPPPKPEISVAEMAAQKVAEAEARRIREEEVRKPPQQFFENSQPVYQGPKIQPPPEPPPEIAYEKAFKEEPLLPPPVRIAVMTSPSHRESGDKVVVLLDNANRETLEQNIGAPIKVIVASRVRRISQGVNEIHYRSGHLRAALEIAGVIPDKQTIEPMTFNEESREGYDIVILLGKELR